jgi:Tol biopolymer transport system component
MGQRLAGCVRAFATVVLLLLASCGGGSPSGNPNPGTPANLDLTGTVQGFQGNPAPSVSIVVSSILTRTDGSGHYSLTGLAAGTYNITAQLGNTVLYRSVSLSAGEHTVDFDFSASDPSFRVESVSQNIEQPLRLVGTISLHLNQAVQRDSVSADDFSFTPDPGPVQITVENNVEKSGDAVITLMPERQLPTGINLRLSVSGNILSLAGEQLRTPLRLAYRTESSDTSQPRLVRTTPEDWTSKFPINGQVRFTYNEPVVAESALGFVDDTPLNLPFVVNGSTVTVTNSTGWEPQTDYIVKLDGVSDAAGNPTADQVHFTTGTQLARDNNISPEWNGALNSIVFASDRFGSYDVFRVDPDGENLTALTTLPGDEREPTVSYDGQLLAWQADEAGGSGHSDIYVAPLNNAEAAVAVTPPSSDEMMPRFSRTSSRSIVFVRNGPQALIYRMAADGSGYAALSPTFGGGEQVSPSPHPLVDNQVLFSTFSSGSDIWSMSVSAIDGSVTPINQTDTLSFEEFEPDWGADASFFVFVSNETGGFDLWLGDLTGGRRQVTDFEMELHDPSTSPVAGSMRCAASLQRVGGGSDIVIIDLVSGTIVRNLTSPGAGN